MAMNWKRIGEAVADFVNVSENLVKAPGAIAGQIANAADEVVDGAKRAVKGAVTEIGAGYRGQRQPTDFTYRDVRMDSPRIQREIESGRRNADGSRKRREAKVKEAKAPDATPISEDGEDVVSQAIKYRQQAQEAKKFTYNGRQYIQMEDGKYYSRAGAKDSWSSISGKEYNRAHTGNVAAQEELGRQHDINQAFGTATTDSEQYDGILDWAKDNQLLAAGAIAGTAIIGAELLDEY